MCFLKPDGSIFNEFTTIIGNGTDGFVLRHDDDHVLKIPKLRKPSSNASKEDISYHDYMNECSRGTLEREKDIYRRIGKCEGVVECIRISDEGILLRYIKGTDLEQYITTHPEPSAGVKRSWITSIITTTLRLHALKILIYDIALRNFMVSMNDMTLKMIDFGQSSLLPESQDMSLVDEDGCTIQTDIFHLGCVIHSIATWSVFECDLGQFDNFKRPEIDNLPSTEGVLAGEYIRHCWNGHYQSVEQLYEDVEEHMPSNNTASGVLVRVLSCVVM